jgi:hypothetical protein
MASGFPLTASLIEKDASGDGGVEGFDGTGRGDGHSGIDAAKDFWWNAATLVPNNKRHRLGKIISGNCLSLRCDGGESFDLSLREFVKEMVVAGDSG